MDFIKRCLRIILLIMVGVAAAMLWMYCNLLLPYDLARGGGSLVLADRAAGIITVLAMILVPAIPVQSLFPKHPVAAAAAIGWMPLAVGLSLLYPIIDGVPNAHRAEFAIIEGCVDWMAVILGTWAVAGLRNRYAISQQSVHGNHQVS